MGAKRRTKAARKRTKKRAAARRPAKRRAAKRKRRVARTKARRTARKPARRRKATRTAKKRTTRRKGAKRRVAKKKAATKRAKRKPNPQFMKPVQPDAMLAEVVGSKPIPRTEITKKLWAYIKKNGLQDKVNRRMINADAALKAVFGGKTKVSMFEMTKLVSKHVK
jgi:chromatin remodeling complex protein RSC6